MLESVSDVQYRLADALAGRYSVERELGRGGMSLVYLAHDDRLGRKVALKILRPELAATLGPERFLREIRVVAGLTHPHILPLHDSGEAAGMLYYVMPYVEGESLRHRLEREGSVPLEDALEIAREVADALEYAHQHDIVHRDIKPENILLQAGQAVVSDFGIARAISEARARVTGTGVAVGTPDYMSPEQASGGTVDGRSDVYSLGCVLYEMLTGTCPGAVSGGATQAPRISAVQPAIPIEVEAAIEEAMAQRPEERFPRAADFARALRAPSMGTVSGVRRRRSSRRRWGALLIGLAAIAALAVLPRVFGSSLDASLYVVVPFGHRGGAAPALVNGDQCELLLSQAFERWTDVRLADPLQVHDARMRRGEIPMTLDEAKRLARDLGAGMLVWGDVTEVGDSIQVTTGLYDLRAGNKRVRDYAVRISKNGRDLQSKFRELADSILLGGVRSENLRPGVVGTDVLAAFYAYADGRDALARWDLASAERSFRAALASDPEYAQASLWLAHTEMWGDEPVADWRANTSRALASSDKLGASDLAIANALGLLADGRFPQACAAYRRLLTQDPADFIAWFGLGECQRRDALVEPDSTSPSNWRFRSSYRGAASAYRRALELLPSAHRAFTGIAIQRLMDLFFAETYLYRSGYAVARDTLRFGAFPSLEQDTLAFTPWAIADFFSGKGGSRPATTQAAVARNREELRKTIVTWIGAFPASADAHEALALILETTGEIDPGPSAERSALAAVQRARGLTRDAEQALRTAVAEVRLLFKLERFGDAAALADSVLAAAPAEPGPFAARRLAGLAVLTGRPYVAAQLLRQSAPLDTPITWDGLEVPDAPIPVKQAGLELLAYASLGVPAESLRALKARVDQRVSSWAGPISREGLRLAVLHVPIGLAFESLGLSDVHRADAGGDYVLEMQWAMAHGDTAAVRAELARQAGFRTRSRAGDVAMDGTYSEARMLLQLRDTTAAVALLDLSLQALPTLGTYLLDQPEQVGCAVRAMALRAELASRARDDATAARWARAVTTLWAKADPPLEPSLQRMRVLAGSARHD
jgi:aminoglycoside phosphotransferase (APT) family kinase protein